MNTWRITGSGLPPLYFEAGSFDEALAMARMVNPAYDTGEVTETEDGDGEDNDV